MSWRDAGRNNPVGKVSPKYFFLSASSLAYYSSFLFLYSYSFLAYYSASFFPFGGISNLNIIIYNLNHLYTILNADILQLFYSFSMYIEPAQYLDISDRVAILSKKCRGLQSQNQNLKSSIFTHQQTIRMLELQVSELQKWKQSQKQGIKDQIVNKTQDILQAIENAKQKQQHFINDKVEKIRNWSAINTLKRLEDRINQNRTVTFQKDFFQKVKILYIIDKKKASCNSTELFNWVKELLTIKNNDPLGTVSNLNEIAQVVHNVGNTSLLMGSPQAEHSQVKPVQEFRRAEIMQQSLLSMRQQIKA